MSWRAALHAFLPLALDLIELHDPSGQQSIWVNPSLITSLRQPLQPEHFARGTHCVVVMNNKNFIAVRETCAVVRQTSNPGVTR
jgi:hypothetical protein